MAKQPLYPHVPKAKQVQFPHVSGVKASAGEFAPGTTVRLKSGSQGWIKATIVEYYDVIPVVGGMMYGGGMTPGYKVHILEGKHKGETIRVPTNYVERVSQGLTSQANTTLRKATLPGLGEIQEISTRLPGGGSVTGIFGPRR